MTCIAGVDIGNNSTEVALGRGEKGGETVFLSSSLVRTSGIKGTLKNALSVVDALDAALEKAGRTRSDLSAILLNEATPVIGDVAMETITETVITESAMIGHNPGTPGGLGLGTGRTVALESLPGGKGGETYIVTIPGSVDFERAAGELNAAWKRGIAVTGAVVQKDDGVLIHNRLDRAIPIVDEVRHIDRIPMGMEAVVEVAGPGKSIDKLSNPYDIATLFDLSPEETRHVVPISRALTGTRSAVVIKTPRGDIRERRIPAGSLTLVGEGKRAVVPMEEGAEALMEKLEKVAPLSEIKAEPGTNVGGMFENVRNVMADLTGEPASGITVRDIIAVDTLVPRKVTGGLAGEFAMGNAVGLAAMVETRLLPMKRLARKLTEEMGVPVSVGGVEADMAIRGALTTPGTDKPLAILDLGGGSTDASIIDTAGKVRHVHLAGAGDMVTLLIDRELGIGDPELSEKIKRNPLAKVETLFHARHEDGSVQFFREHIDPKLYGRVVVTGEDGMVPVEPQEHLPRIREVRRKAKEKVFVKNALRALGTVAPAGNIRLIGFVALVGGSALDFEIPKMIADALTEYGVVVGRANIRGSEGPRNAVATGLLLSNGHG